MSEDNKSPWSFFSSDVLQKYIGDNILNQLSFFLPLLRKDNFNESNIYKKKNLSLIFNSFSGPDLLEKKKFRNEFFSSLSDEILIKLYKSTPILNEKYNRALAIESLTNIKWEKNIVTENICKILNIDINLLPEESISYPLIETDFEIIGPFKQLKKYQFPVVFEALEALKIVAKRFIIQMPTGSGKTRVAMEIISQYLNDQKSEKPINIVWLAHQKELCAQAYQCFIEVWSHLKNTNLSLYRLWDEGDDTQLPSTLVNNSFIIGNFQKIFSELRKSPQKYNQIKKNVDLIIIDEAHKTIAPTYKEVINTLASSTTQIVGLTATPGRSLKNDSENEKLSNFFHDTKIEIQGKNIITYLRNEKVLSKAIYEPIITEEKITLSPKQKKYIEEFYELPKDIIDKLSQSNLRNFEILKRIDKIIHEEPNSKILFFALDINHSKFVCAILNTIGINAGHVDGKTSRNRRANLLKDFKMGKLKVLCNERLMSTGFDAPKTDTIIIAKPTFSIVLYSQIIGRGLRGPAIGGTEYCKIIDVKDNIQGYSDLDLVYEYFDDYFIKN